MIKVQNNPRRFVCFLLVALASFVFANSASAVVLGISGNRFTLDGQAKFLVIAAYFDGMDSPNPISDLDYLKSKGFDGIRIFPNWWENVRPLTSDSDPLITANGSLDQAKLNKLISIVDGVNSRGMIVDISFAREVVDGNCSDSAYNTHVLCKQDFKNGVVAVARALRNKTNVFYDLSNEHDITGFPRADVVDLKGMVENAIGTSSIISVSSVEDGPGAISIANSYPMDLVSVHFACGSPNSGCEFDANIQSTLTSGKPTYIGEPNNTNTIGSYSAQDFIDAVVKAKTVGVAAWTFHTDAGWYLNGASLQSQLNSSQETGFINGYYQAVQNATWGSGGGGTVPPPSSGACINPAPATSTVPDMKSVVQSVAAAHPDWLMSSCNDYNFIDEVIRQLRAGPGGTRWAYEGKRANLNDPWMEGISYYYGTGTAPTTGTMSQYEVFAIDIAHQDCNNPTQSYADWNVADWPYRSPNLV
ncbi:MAG: hypothetical protein Q8P69_00155, partial [bacterium]|nr:hypothetical protein [bacterium]